MTLGETISLLWPQAVWMQDYSTTIRVGGETIDIWNTAKLGPQPTVQFLLDKESEVRQLKLLRSREDLYRQLSDPLKPEAEAELRQGRPTKYFEYMAKRFQIRRETEPEETRLDLVKKDQVSYWKTVCDMMIESKYPTTNMLAYKDLKDQAYAEGKLNRFAYLNQISTWGMALFQEFYTVEAYINAAPTVDFAIAQAIDLKAWEAADPKVTFAGALALAD